MLASKEGEADGEESRVRAGGLRSAVCRRYGSTVNAVVEPVLGDVAIDERIARDVQEFKIEDKPQEQSGKDEDQEEGPKLPSRLKNELGSALPRALTSC